MTDEPLEVTFLLDYLAAGGAERHAVTLANHLDRSRFAVSLVRLKPGGELEGLIDKPALTQFECADVRKKLDFAAVARLARHLELSRCRVVVAANPFATLYAMLAARRIDPRPAVVSTFHSTIIRGAKNQAQMLFYRAMYPFCDVLVYVCDSQRRYWRRRAMRARTETVIYNGIDTAFFAADSKPGEIAAMRHDLGFGSQDWVVGICAALRPEKAHADLLQAIARLRSQGLPVRCLVIGDGAERPRLEALMSTLGISDRVTITGHEMDVRRHVAACDVMVLASHSETFSLSALESMAMAKPMVMTRTGGAAEQVIEGETGLLFEPGDIDALTRHLASLADPAHCASMGKRAAEDVRRRFPLGKMLDEYSQLFEQLGRGRKVSRPPPA